MKVGERFSGEWLVTQYNLPGSFATSRSVHFEPARSGLRVVQNNAVPDESELSMQLSYDENFNSLVGTWKIEHPPIDPHGPPYQIGGLHVVETVPSHTEHIYDGLWLGSRMRKYGSPQPYSGRFILRQMYQHVG